MVNYSRVASANLDATFGALADPTRRAILARLARGESCVTELAKPFDVTLPAISKHLRVLESAGLLAREKDGRVHRCRLAGGPMKDAAAWIDHYRAFWEGQFDTLARYLETSQAEEKQTWQHRSKTRTPGSSSGAPSRRRGKKSSAPGRTGRR